MSAPLRHYYMDDVNVPTEILKEIGLTKNEIKVYVALLKLGSETKKAIVKESGITPSKLYTVTDRLIDKGLVSKVKKNGVYHFSAAPPEQVLDFLDQKKQRIDEQADAFKDVIPELTSLEQKQDQTVEVFTGWDGLRTIYNQVIRAMPRGSENYVLGATSGTDEERTRRFFLHVCRERRAKNIGLRLLVNEDDEAWANKIVDPEENEEIQVMEHVSPTEVSIWDDHVLITTLTDEPVVVHLHGADAASSFMNYFNKLWT